MSDESESVGKTPKNTRSYKNYDPSLKVLSLIFKEFALYTNTPWPIQTSHILINHNSQSMRNYEMRLV